MFCIYYIINVSLFQIINVTLLSGFYYSSCLKENNKEILLLVAIRSVTRD